MDLTQLLPEEVLADVLRRVAPHGLAACRCASKALCGIIDARRLLLPISVGGIFSVTSTAPAISGRFDCLPPPCRDCHKIKDHCNGLLLVDDYEDLYVVNPATRQWDRLPPLPSVVRHIHPDFQYQEYLVFDPAVSYHYEVFIIITPFYKEDPRDFVYSNPGDFVYNSTKDQADPCMNESEWPPSVCALHTFSSRSGRWEERSFIRDGKAAGTIADMQCWDFYEYDGRYAVYWRDALYVHCKTDFIMRISLTNDKYQVIKPPIDYDPKEYQKFHLGRSEKRLYLATIFKTSRLMVWLLEESCGKTNWVLVHTNCLTPILDYDRPVLGPWVLQDINFNEYLKVCKERNKHDLNLEYLIEKKLAFNSGKEELVEEKFEWDSENDNILHKQDVADAHGNEYFSILGFHPYKEIVFLDISMKRGLAYHLKDSKVQDLGYLYPTSYDLAYPNDRFIAHSFAYTPCWTGHQKATRL